MPPEPVLRDARPDDLDRVRSLLAACYEPYRPEFGRDAADAYLREVDDVASRAMIAELIVAEAGGDLVGAVTFLPDSSDDDHPWPDGGSVLRLLAVNPRHRGRGIGGLLTDECVRRARRRGSSFLALHTAPFMEAARRVYEQAGFRPAPAHDFDPFEHYGPAVSEPDRDRMWGIALVLDLTKDDQDGG